MIIDTEEISLLQDKIIDYERQIIKNNKTLEFNKSQITLLEMKSAGKNKVINSLENRIDELDAMNKKFENHMELQSRAVISYLEKIQKLEDYISSFESRLEETRLQETSIEDSHSNTKPSMLNRIFKNSK